MLSIQETVQKDEVKEQLRLIRKTMDSYGQFHPALASIYNVESDALRLELRDTLNKIPLREFLAKSGTTGIAGAGYLVPDKLHDTLIAAGYRSDKVPLFAADVVNGWNGGDLKVDIAVRQPEGTIFKWSLRPSPFVSGGQMSTETVETVQATLSPVGFSVAPRITSDLIEDENFGLVEWHFTHAAQQIGQYATDLAIADLKAAADGDGTQCVVAAGAGTTSTAQVVEAMREVGSEFWLPDTLIVTAEAWGDAMYATAYHIQTGPLPEGYDLQFQVLDGIMCNSKNLHGGVTAGKMTKCVTLVLDRSAALLCGRKRWMQVEKYADPVRDLAAAVISCRQDCVTLYKDASAELTET